MRGEAELAERMSELQQREKDGRAREAEQLAHVSQFARGAQGGGAARRLVVVVVVLMTAAEAKAGDHRTKNAQTLFLMPLTV